MAISRQELLDNIRKYVKTHDGKIPGERSFAAATRIRQSSWKGRYWARWTDAVREAGYKANTLTQKVSDEDILARLANLVTKLGHFPVRDEINMEARQTPGLPTWETVRKRYGGMPETAEALLELSRKTGNKALGALCEGRLQREASRPVPVKKQKAQAAAKTGFVYLKYSPSLRLYKIGKANDAERRGMSIGILLPTDLVPRHEIKTDQPNILERYWHARFQQKRKQGEWFDLNTDEVEAFKKRREFMFSEFFP